MNQIQSLNAFYERLRQLRVYNERARDLFKYLQRRSTVPKNAGGGACLDDGVDVDAHKYQRRFYSNRKLYDASQVYSEYSDRKPSSL